VKFAKYENRLIKHLRIYSLEKHAGTWLWCRNTQRQGKSGQILSAYLGHAQIKRTFTEAFKAKMQNARKTFFFEQNNRRMEQIATVCHWFIVIQRLHEPSGWNMGRYGHLQLRSYLADQLQVRVSSVYGVTDDEIVLAVTAHVGWPAEQTVRLVTEYICLTATTSTSDLLRSNCIHG